MKRKNIWVRKLPSFYDAKLYVKTTHDNLVSYELFCETILSNMAKTPIFVAVFSYDSVTGFYFTFLPTIYAAVISDFRNHYLELMTIAFLKYEKRLSY